MLEVCRSGVWIFVIIYSKVFYLWSVGMHPEFAAVPVVIEESSMLPDYASGWRLHHPQKYRSLSSGISVTIE